MTLARVGPNVASAHCLLTFDTRMETLFLLVALVAERRLPGGGSGLAFDFKGFGERLRIRASFLGLLDEWGECEASVCHNYHNYGICHIIIMVAKPFLS